MRYEEITDPRVALELFEPFPPLLQEIAGFGNAMIYGHRGSGKSTYLASLAYFPEVSRPIVDVREKFGVFFACRQGEFKQFATDLLEFSPMTKASIKHIIILKIIRRIIDTLRSAVEFKKLNDPEDYGALHEYLVTYVADGAMLHYDRELISPLENLHASLLRNEILEIDKLFRTEHIASHEKKYLDERRLIEFIEVIRHVFRELRKTQFYILFDDAGSPNVSQDTQRIFNDIIRCVNSNY